MAAVKAKRQRNLDLITSSTLIVGVDGHSKSNTAAFNLASGKEALSPKKFENSRKGFLWLLDKVEWITKKHNLDNVIYVLEPNGPYWMLLARFLAERNFVVKVVNAYQVKMNRATEDPSPEKNDWRDARSIADLGRQGKFNDTTLPGPVYEDLRSLARLREGLTESRSAQKHRLRAMLVRNFPELPSIVSDILGKSVRALLRAAPTAESVASLGVEGVEQLVKAASRGRFGVKKAKQIVYAAGESVGYGRATSAVRIAMAVTLNTIEGLTQQIETIEDEMHRLLMETEEGMLVLSIPGIGEVTAATVLGETGGLRQYQNPNQIRKLCGLDLCGSQSGDRQSEKRISKRGRRLLRKSLYQAAVACIRSNDILAKFYRGLIDPARKKTLAKKKALIAVMGKLVEIMFSLVRSGSGFNPNYKWISPGQDKPVVQAMAA